MNQSGRIWRATVQPTSTVVPNPGNSSTENIQDVYTKTSLTANSDLRNLNREILNVSQSYNNTPKPFRREKNEATMSNSRVTYSACPMTKSDLQQVKFVQQNSIQVNPSTEQVGCVKQTSQEENMAPKLIHKQYNSPIDLYSMNNIRKTIEAHTELIAPGIKGINFMKPETPVNKQSEVYKLVKEEEEQRNQQRTARFSPISGQPVNHGHNIASTSLDIGVREQHQNIHHQEKLAGKRHAQSNVTYSKIETSGEQNSKSQLSPNDGSPSCCECGQYISGPFAKIQSRFVHPHCFNCTTCGTSLKNTGYFTINEKLYCEIHAQQVAKVLRIKFEFEDKQDQQSKSYQTSTRQLQVQEDSRSQQTNELNVPTTSNKQLSHSTGSTVNISTILANRDGNTNSQDKQESDWSCAHASCKNRTSTVESRSPHLKATRLNVQQQESSIRRSPSPITQQQSILSSGETERSLFGGEHTPVGARTPVCVHCHVRIQGPYILAGKTTWCKVCSQNNFQCSSCYRSLLDTGFIEDSSHKYYCEHCFEAYYAPICSKCNIRIKGDCLNALNKQWHPSCFVCGHCHRPFGNSSFYLEDNVPYCERDWNMLFTTKCYSCSNPIEAGDKWIEALNRNYHSNCFNCTYCQTNLEGSTFCCKNGKPYCRLHAR